jgi:hypothetical protein
MTHLFKLARRAARLRAALYLALAVVFAACTGDSLTNSSSDSNPTETGDPGSIPAGPSFSTSFRGGIPFGTFALPTSYFGTRYNGGMRNIDPNSLLRELQAIKERGGKVVLNLAGAPPRYTDSSGRFSLTMWKASVDRFKGIDFSSYIQDGTVAGNFLIDEPNDAANWNGTEVSEATVEELARYSKSRWPGMPTIARARPAYFTGTYQYLDAVWSQYHSKFGDPTRFISEDVAKAKSKGLALVVGLNILDGNNGSTLTPSQIESWGSIILADAYPCAFLSWKYNEAYLGRSDIGQAMGYLATKAANRATKSCRGGPTTEPSDSGTTAPGITGPLTLTLGDIWSADGRDYVRLKWSGARTSTVDVYRNGAFRKNVENDGRQTFIRPLGDLSSYSFKLCEKGSSTCSNTVTAKF